MSNLSLVLAADNSPAGLSVAQAIQQGLKKAGITVTIKPYDSDALTEVQTGAKGDYDLTVSSWLPDYPSALGNIQPLFASTEIGNGGYNMSRYSNPAVDAAINAATAESDRDQGRRGLGCDRPADHEGRSAGAAHLRAQRVPARLEGAELLPAAIPAVPEHADHRFEQVTQVRPSVS